MYTTLAFERKLLLSLLSIESSLGSEEGSDDARTVEQSVFSKIQKGKNLESTITKNPMSRHCIFDV